MDYTTYLEQLHIDLLAVVNAQHALLVFMAALIIYLVFFREGRR